MKPKFFKTPADFRAWLEANHEESRELLVGFYKRDSGKPSITWPESVDQALCFGWIDGIRKTIDDVSYTIRFTPRRATSNWSAVNTKRADELIKEGLIRPSGLAAFQKRKTEKTGIYSYENRPGELPAPYSTKFQQNKKAWDFFQAQPPGYRKTTTWWIISAKKEETRLKRLETLIEQSAEGRRIGLLTPPKGI